MSKMHITLAVIADDKVPTMCGKEKSLDKVRTPDKDDVVCVPCTVALIDYSRTVIKRLALHTEHTEWRDQPDSDEGIVEPYRCQCTILRDHFTDGTLA